MTCSGCGKEIDRESEQYAVLWDLPKVSFICLPCSENYEDVTEEVKAPK